MSKQIWKYEINIGKTKRDIPSNATILSVGLQGNNICVWALVDTEARTSERTFYVYGTGWDIEESVEYLSCIGTVQDNNGLVWHVFEV